MSCVALCTILLFFVEVQTAHAAAGRHGGHIGPEQRKVKGLIVNGRYDQPDLWLLTDDPQH